MINSQNVGRIAERIVANEFEARGFRVSDLNKDGLTPNADLIAISPNRTLQIQVKGSTNRLNDRWWVGYGYLTEKILAGDEPMFNRRKSSVYKADIVVLVAVRSPTEYSCVVLPVDVAEEAVRLHLIGWTFKPHITRIEFEPSRRARTPEKEHLKKERELLALYRDEPGWARLLQSN